MSASGAEGSRASVGRRIARARRELGLTQAELAGRIGVSLGVVDRYETGRADPSDRLGRIAEATGKPVSWFTSSSMDDPVGEEAVDHPTDVGRRIALSRRRRGLTRRELADAVGVPLGKIERYESGDESPSELVERIAGALGEPSSWLRAGGPKPPVGGEADLAQGTEEHYGGEGEGGVMSDSRPAEPEVVSIDSARSALPAPPLEIKYEDLPRKTLGYNPRATAELFDQVAETYRHLWDDRGKLERKLERLQAELAEEQEKKRNPSADAGLTEKLKQADASRRELALQLEQVTSALADSRAQETRLSEQMSELETEVRLAEERAAAAADRHEQANKELERFREQERALAESLVWARHTASELSEKAEQEAKQIVADAERKAAELLADGQREVERLTSERDRLETLASEFQDDLSVFLLGTLERLKERVEPTEEPDEPVPDASGDGEPQKTGRARQS